MNEIKFAFFASSANDVISRLLQVDEWTLETQLHLLDNTANHEINKLFPRSVSFQKHIFKKLISLIESSGLEVHHLLYEHLSHLMTLKSTEKEDEDYNTYFIEDKRIVISNRKSIVESGTTGMHCWPSGKGFANFALRNKHFFENKCVVEIGAGTGLTGIVITRFCHPRFYLFTDHNLDVISLIRKNVAINEVTENCSVAQLDFCCDEEMLLNAVGIAADVLIGCDVVFDVDVVPHLCRLIRTFTSKWRCKVFLMSVVRDVLTIDSFEKGLRREKLEFRREEVRWETENRFAVDGQQEFVLHLIN